MLSYLFDYVGLALDFAVTAYLVKLHRKECKIVDNIKGAPAIQVGTDLTSLLNACPNQSLPYAAIRGRVTQADDSIESSITGTKGVMQIVTLEKITMRRFGDFWDMISSHPLTEETTNSVPFELSSLSSTTLGSSHISVQVEKPKESSCRSLLLSGALEFTPSSDFALTPGIGSKSILGVLKSENILPLGSIVTGIGQIVTDAEGNIRLQQILDGDNSSYPYMITTLSIEDLVRKLEGRKNFQRIIIGMTISVGLILLSRRFLSWRQDYKMRKLRETILEERRNINWDTPSIFQICLVCQVNPREVILLDCGHVCVCTDCVLKVNGCCPICRKPIVSTRRAYIA